MFNAILLDKHEDGSTRAQLTQLDDAQLPADGNVTVRIDYSTISFNDGLAQGLDLPGSVAPFILLGIGSVTAPRARRERAWQRLVTDLKPDLSARIATEIGLAQALDRAPDIVAGKVRGRPVVDVNRT